MNFLKGKKTYLIAAIAAAVAFANAMEWNIPAWSFELIAALGLGTLRAGIGKVK